MKIRPMMSAMARKRSASHSCDGFVAGPATAICTRRTRMSAVASTTPTPSVAVSVCTKRCLRPKKASTAHSHRIIMVTATATMMKPGAQAQVDQLHMHETRHDIRGENKAQQKIRSRQILRALAPQRNVDEGLQ